MKRKYLSRIALFLCALMAAPMLFACGNSDNDSTTAAPADQPSSEATTPAPTTTEEPTTTEPTTAKPTMEPVDPSLPYYQQMDLEFAFYGFKFDDKSNVLMAETEEDTMKKLTLNGGIKKEDLDVSGDKVPFTKAYRIIDDKLPDNPTEFWVKNYNAKFMKEASFVQGDLIVGCVWIRNGGGENPGKMYIAMKTPTDNWATEGGMSINLVEATDQWTKVYFYGEVQIDEPVGNKLELELFMGYDPHKIDVGGLYVKRVGADQFKACLNMPYGQQEYTPAA